ncbi:hypothetical protein [Wolbachia endosymbiont of Chironomus riparius]|nr:hypothetical protein [Wolbachia endosymbiont of Chironomus riparius]
MSNDKTERGYSLPHPNNIAVNEHNQLKNNFERFSFETFLNL